MSGIRGLPISERFWSKVDKSSECWLWTGSRDARGYGTFSMATPKGRRPITASRVAMMLEGFDVEGFDVCHRCDNPPCVNPDHLFLGSAKDNLRDASRKGRMHGGYKLSDDDVRFIRASDESHEELAKRFGVFWKTIYKIRKGERHSRVI